MKNHKKWLLSAILFSTLLLSLGVQAQDGEMEVTETETSSLVTTAEESEVSSEETVVSSSEAETTEEDIESKEDETSSVPTTDNGENKNPTMIFGPDDRMLVSHKNTSPYKQVVAIEVYLDNQLAGYGSGVLIAPNKVLTAAHVIRDVDTNETSDYVIVSPVQHGINRPYG